MWDDEQQHASVRERFKLLLASHRHELVPVARQAREGELLMRQGAPATSLVLLCAGRVAVELSAAGATPHRLTTLDAEQLLGEMGLFGNGHHAADIRVVDGPAELVEVDGQAFLGALLFDADLAGELLGLLSLRCQRGNAVIGLLLDAIVAATAGDAARLQTLTDRLAALSDGLAQAASGLQQLSGRRSAPAG